MKGGIKLSWQFTNDKPIFQQIVDIITQDIIKGKYNAGEKLPPVREMAIEAGVNPNTMQKAFVQIEQDGLIYTKRGDGRYVSEDSNILKSKANNHLHDIVKNAVTTLLLAGFTKEEILNSVKKQLGESE